MITENEKRLYEVLESLNIKYTRYEHEPIYTVEQAKKIDKNIIGRKCKNLFLKNSKGDKFYLYIIDEDKRADLKSLSKQIGSTRLSFANEEELYDHLKLTRGSVTPFGIINDVNSEVIVLIDTGIKGEEVLDFHPNVNTSTIGISYDDLEKFIRYEKNDFYHV